MNKVFYTVLGIVLILIGVSAFLWFSQPADVTEPPYHTHEGAKHSAHDHDHQPSTVSKTIKSKVMDKFGDFFSEEDLANPEMKRMFEILESPAGQEFLESNPNGLADTLAFFESQGVKVNRNMFTERYREVFPTGEPEELEAEMRQRLVEAIDSAETDPQNSEELNHFIDNLTEFLKDEQNYAWVSGRFQGNNRAFSQWVIQTLQNPGHSPVEQMSETLVNDGEDAFETPRDAQDAMEIQDPVVTPTDAAELSPETPASEGELPTTEIELLELLTENPPEMEGENLTLELPTEAEFEASLREQFNPERYQKAMSTLKRYGPEEGLRRLKTDDPDIAKQIEPLLNRQEKTQ
ncbi:hypothetical protein F4054_10750 [Candidatus Poribacteria bacterium]|nr:hypothetical protein [Candidatus Poribacteria bacterium]MYG07689.1 hypothetical protein [Candidatus Poribacteria bacterium]MYK22723.1 hypothetical protein [Candidatus Poribacteria bacterium]